LQRLGCPDFLENLMSSAIWLLAGFALGAMSVGLGDSAHGERRRARRTPDDLLVQRVRARLGHFTTHPKSIHVRARNGRVALRGVVLAGERPDLVAAVRRVAGVEALDDGLITYLDGIGVPELQGGDPPES
jgi:hypothetical protein